jgi:tetratricopeptide (TPR) repeat protein
MRRFVAALCVALALGVNAEAKNDWFAASSEHFTLVSNGRQGRAKDILEDLEQLRRLITEIFPDQRVDSARPALFYAFQDEKSMRPFQPTVGGERESWAGMYRPTMLRDVVLFRGDGSSDEARQMAFSQYTHILEGYTEADYPVWLSNGLARFYSNAEISDEQASIGKLREATRRVFGEFRSVPLRELLAVDHASAFYRDLDRRPLFDAQSWALVHYLLIGQIREGGPERLGQYLQLLQAGAKPLPAFEQVMGKPLDAVDQDLALYVRKSISLYLKIDLPPLEIDKDFRVAALDDAEVDAHLGQLFAATGYYSEAETSLARSIEAKPDQVVAYEAMAIVRRRQERFSDVANFLERAIQQGSTNPYVHLGYARDFVNARDANASSAGEPTPALVFESLRFVMREGPELVDAARLFAFLALFEDDKREEALEAVTKALERAPGNPSLVFMLGQLYAKDGRYAAARALFQKLLERSELDAGLEAAVRQQYDHAEAKLKFEAQQAERRQEIEAAAAAATQEDAGVGPRAADEPADISRTAVGEVVATNRIVEVRGRLVRFDCTDGHRFIIADGELTYALDIIDLARVEILEDGKRVGTRDFYCGPLDELVVARYIPGPAQDGALRKSGRVVAIDFVRR